MIYFFGSKTSKIYAVQVEKPLLTQELNQLKWLLGEPPLLDEEKINGLFVSARAAMPSPWSTNVVEITQNIGIKGIKRVEEFSPITEKEKKEADLLLTEVYTSLHQDMFNYDVSAVPKVFLVDDIAAYNEQEGLALSEDEVEYLERLSNRIGRKLTDSEVFGFSQVNSEHCRHKIFNGTFVIDGVEQESSLFQMIKKTSKENSKYLVSAYKDNVAFVKGPKVVQFAPSQVSVPSNYGFKDFQSVISLKAETHNYPTTVEPFNGAGTGSGGEVRDRLAGGQGSIPLAGAAVYMTSYSRLNGGRSWEKALDARDWLYQSPLEILLKATKGAADFGNKFGQPLITGSILTFEHQEHGRKLGFDKVIMMAGGIGYTKEEQSQKLTPKKGDKIVVMGGPNYRIGMGGASVSSVESELDSPVELNAVQRSNPEIQKRVSSVIRAMVESDTNVISSIHDHGAGGHLNCFSELVEDSGGKIDLDLLPIGDPTLSAKEIIGNESQERMGIIIPEKDLPILQAVADRERAPLYVVGEVTDDLVFKIESSTTGEKPMDLNVGDLLGSTPMTIMTDKTLVRQYEGVDYQTQLFETYLGEVLQLEAVACKDWLINRMDRSVTGLVAKQPTAGPLQLPLNNCGVMALDFQGKEGIATAVGHAPAVALIDEAAGSRMAIAEALTNMIWAPLEYQIDSISLSANWMWPCKEEGEDARLYNAVKACSEFAIALGINIPTGKDSLSMKQKYPDDEVVAPGTVIITAVGHCNDIQKVVEPVLKKNDHPIYYINLSNDNFELGGSSFAQILNKIGSQAPDVKDASQFIKQFNAVQTIISQGKVDAGHDIGSGGLITTLLELCFADNKLGADIDLSSLGEKDALKVLFSENVGVVFQADSSVETELKNAGVKFHKIGKATENGVLKIKNYDNSFELSIDQWRDTWYKTSYFYEQHFNSAEKAKARFENYKKQGLSFQFGEQFKGKTSAEGSKRPQAAIIREKGSNSEREMAYALYTAGFDVRDVHMTDILSGRETLEDVHFLAAVGGATNSDALGAAKGWTATFKYNEQALKVIKNFFARPDTLSLGVGNGCQLFIELGLLFPQDKEQPKMLVNESNKFESIFSAIKIEENDTVMFSSLSGTTLGAWSSNLEGRFQLPLGEDKYQVAAKYALTAYPANPFGSDYNTAILSDRTGRHIVTMAHLERAVLPWQWAFYPEENKSDEVAPWIVAFENARKWIVEK